MPIIWFAAPESMAVPEFRRLGLAGLIEIRPDRFKDDRGFFSEVWRDEWLADLGPGVSRFVQDNHSFSSAAGIVRGLHYQIEPAAQDKLVRVVRGSVFDVAVDLRRQSPTFGQCEGLVLSRDEGNMLFVPKGFAHGFMTLEPECEVSYKVSAPYSAELERAIAHDDPDIAIPWPRPGAERLLSPKDRSAPRLAEVSDVF